MIRMKNPARSATGGVSTCLADGLDASNNSRNHNKTQFQSCAGSPSDFGTGQRLERQIEHVHALGPRVFAELLGDIARRTGQSSFIADRLQSYAALDPEAVRFAGGDHFPPMPLGLIR